MEEEKFEDKGLLAHKKIPIKVMLKRTMKYVMPQWRLFLLGIILLCLNVGCDLLLPKFVEWLTGNVSIPFDPAQGTGPGPLSVIIWIAVGYLLIAIINQFFLYLETMVLTKAGQRIVKDLRIEVFQHIESMSQNQFNDMAVGSLVTRVCNYTSSMTEFFTSTLVRILKNVLLIIFTFVIMMSYSWILGLIMLGISGLVFGISYGFSVYVHKIFHKERDLLSKLNTFMNETLSGMKIVQLFNQEKKFDKKFIKQNEEYRKTRYKVTIAFGIYRPLISLIYIGCVALTLFMGKWVGLTAAAIVGFYLYLTRFFSPIQELADELNHITRAFTAMEKLFNLLDIEPEVVDKPNAKDILNFQGKIEFKHVWFAYEGENWILKDISFVVNPKETVAFVGATGAGKTTILGLIVRNFEIQKGQILIDDVDIQDIKLDSLRRGIGQMLQDVFLFTGNIRDNITLFDNHFSDDEIKAACDYVNVSSIIDKLDNGLDSQVIERGENFSTGQRQLLSFARTVLHKPQIMILDEATANIDTETEVKIQESLEKMKNIGTMLIVAHRLSTIQHSDKIIVLSKGEIIESGNHQQLLKNKGHYYKLYKLQFEEK